VLIGRGTEHWQTLNRTGGSEGGLGCGALPFHVTEPFPCLEFLDRISFKIPPRAPNQRPTRGRLDLVHHVLDILHLDLQATTLG
jgi:hypothetical protein